jgi:hypothetical protein
MGKREMDEALIVKKLPERRDAVRAIEAGGLPVTSPSDVEETVHALIIAHADATASSTSTA